MFAYFIESVIDCLWMTLVVTLSVVAIWVAGA